MLLLYQFLKTRYVPRAAAMDMNRYNVYTFTHTYTASERQSISGQM